MIKNTLIIALLIALIYLYYQQKKTNFLTGNSSDSAETIQELQTQLQQAGQLQEYNTQQLTNYESQVNRLKEQLTNLRSEGDWETKTAEVIQNLEAEVSDLTTERDEAVRDKRTTEQEYLSLNNRLKNKSQEADNKVQEIERLKKEKSEVEIRLNRSLTEWKEKYSKQGKLLDTEQLESKKLEEEKGKLEEKIKELTKSKSTMPGEWSYEEDLEKELSAKQTKLKEQEQKITELTKSQQDQLRQINLLFDEKASDYQ